MSPDVGLLDAEPRTREQIELVLRGAGYTVTSFASPQAALADLEGSGVRLLIAELMLPGMDGLEFWAEVRRAWGDRFELLCTSGVSWGYMNLTYVLSRRFNAGWLAKPFLRSELIARVHRAIGPPVAGGAAAPTRALDFRVGVEDAARVDALAAQFEKRMASIRLSGARSHVRSHLPYDVKVNENGEWVGRAVRDISSGGLFIESAAVPPLHQVLDLLLDVPTLPESVRLRARVVRCVPSDPTPGAAGGGYAVEFVEPSEEVRKGLELFVRERLNQEGIPKPVTPEDSIGRRRPRRATVLLIAAATGDLLARAGFLHRREFELLAVGTLEQAEDAVRARQPSLVVVHERILGADTRPALTRLSRLAAKDRLVLLGVGVLPPALVASVCGALIPADTPTDELLTQLQERLGLIQRAAPRINHRTRTRADTLEQCFEAEMIDLGTGGALLKAQVDLAVGTQLTVTFDLPEVKAVICRGQVVRSQRDRIARRHLLGVAFTAKDVRATEALRRFVQSHLHFRDFLTWAASECFPHAAPGRISP